jgi:hypothetical protein
MGIYFQVVGIRLIKNMNEPGQSSLPNDTLTTQSPYAYMKLAREFEAAENLRSAEAQFKYAVRAADKLPLSEYRRVLRLESIRYQSDPKYESRPGVTRIQMEQAYCEVLSLPFMTRVELAAFYARHSAHVEAQESCKQAFSMPPDTVCLRDPRVQQFYNRAILLRQTLDEMVGPDELERLFAENFSKLDLDGNGFVHHDELERAQFDLTLSPDCQLLIRHLLSHYFEVEAAHDDEWGLDIKGISHRDLKTYADLRNRGWKRMEKTQPPKLENKHVW